MTRSRILVLSSLCLALGVLWIVWVYPKRVDMSSFAPANSLIYLEANRPSAVLDALQGTEAWQLMGEHQNSLKIPARRGWLQHLLRATGIGPIDSVIMARLQVAVVVIDLAASEEGETLNVKPEATVILETHTAESRVRPPIERVLQDLATNAYGSPQPQRSSVDGVQYVEWKNPNGTRELVATFFGSVVIVGNSRRAVDTCLKVVRRRAPSLKENPDLNRTRVQHDSSTALAFGFVPASSSGRLMSVGLPILFGRGPADGEFQSLINKAATKIFGRLAWSCRTFKGGIEDRYQISLQHSVVAQLKPHWGSVRASTGPLETIDFYSMSRYKFEDPLGAWQSLKTTISGHVDALGAVVFNSILNSGLLAYGIEEPEAFLGAVQGDIRTVRIDQHGDRQLLVAPVRDLSKLTELFETRMRFKKQRTVVAGTSVFESSDGSKGVALNGSIVVVGHPTDVQQYFLRVAEGKAKGYQGSRQITYFADPNDSSHVSTYTNDTERVGSFLSAILSFSGSRLPSGAYLEGNIGGAPYAVTESTLGDEGVERVTRSPVGQFGTLLPLIIPIRLPQQTFGDPK